MTAPLCWFPWGWGAGGAGPGLGGVIFSGSGIRVQRQLSNQLPSSGEEAVVLRKLLLDSGGEQLPQAQSDPSTFNSPLKYCSTGLMDRGLFGPPKLLHHSHSRYLSLGTHGIPPPTHTHKQQALPQSRSQDLGVILFCAHTALLSLMENRIECLCTCTLTEGDGGVMYSLGKLNPLATVDKSALNFPV